ncbi:MAG: phosphonoacetaldehyde hydrolase [Anaerolineales bacterium]|nr:phosphonoacetaldehyde hydrolase [Anaerolineales bacterium]
MAYITNRIFDGPLKAVILDWAGTTVDFGSFAPTAVFIQLFASRGVTVSVAQARAPMGLMKKDHLRAIAAQPEVAAQWALRHGRAFSDADLDALFEDFIPMQMACLTEYAEPIPGVVATIAAMRARGLKIGSTTGYTRAMMDVLVPEAARRGYQPDTWVGSDDTPAGRPAPWMIYQNAMQLDVFPMDAIVKIGDTFPDIEEGLNAGTWTIGLAMTGNLLGLTEAELNACPQDELAERRNAIYAQLYHAGAHFVVDSLADCLPIFDEIDRLLKTGEKP